MRDKNHLSLKDRALIWLANKLEATMIGAAKTNPLIRDHLLAKPSDLIAEAFGTELSSDDLECLAEQFCAEYDRAPLPHLAVHDALHMILEQAPTSMGEAVVIHWQITRGCYDPSLLGLWTVIVAALPLGNSAALGALVQLYRKLIDRYPMKPEQLLHDVTA